MDSYGPYDGQEIVGWITQTIDREETIIYGSFKTREEAEGWLHNLVGGKVLPIFAPAFNRG